MPGFTDEYEITAGDASFTLVTHINFCTADPEDGTGEATGNTRAAYSGGWTQEGTQVSGRRRWSNTAALTISNDSGSTISVTHLVTASALTGGVRVHIMDLPSPTDVPSGVDATWQPGEITFEIG